MKSMRAVRWLGLAAISVMAATAWAAGVDDFSLLKAVPADASITIATRDHSGKEFVNKQWARVMDAVEKAKFDQVIKRAIKLQMEKEGHPADDFDAHWQKISDLIAGVEWSKLGGREYACGMKFAPLPAPFEFVSLMKSPADKVKPNFDGLAAIFKSVSEFAGEALTLSTEGEGEQVVHKLSVNGAPVPIVLTLALQKDVILIGFGSSLPEQALALLKGEKGTSILASPRFKEALSKLAPPTDMVTFIDQAKMIGQFRLFISDIMKNIPDGDPADPEAAKMATVKTMPGKLFDLLDIFDMTAVTGTTQGMKSTMESCTTLRDDAKGKAFYQLLYGGKTIADPLKFVPKNAGNFTVASGWDVSVLYPTIVKFVQENVPEGKENVAQFEEMAKAQGWDIQKDIFGWMGSGFVSFSIPGATSYAPSDFAFMIQTKDEAKANELLGRLFAAIEPMAGAKGGAVTDAEIEGAPGFKAISIPQMAMLGVGKIVLGVKDGWLMVASGPKVAAGVLAVAAGKEPNVGTNERFQKEGLKPGKDTRSISFADKTKFGEEMSQMLGMANMMQMAIPPEAQKEPMVAVLMQVMAKLPNIVRKIDFLQSQASVSTFDGKYEITRQVVNYREPPAAPAKPAEGEAPAEKKPTKQ